MQVVQLDLSASANMELKLVAFVAHLVSALPALKGKGHGHDTDSQDAHCSCGRSYNGSGSTACATTHASLKQRTTGSG